MNKPNTIYVDLDGTEWDLSQLDAAERKLVGELRKLAAACEQSSATPIQRWCDFDNAWMPKVLAFYKARKLTHKHVIDTPVYEIAQDLSGRIAISLGLVRKADYRDHLRDIIASDFHTRRAFCKATGLSEDMLSHVLAGRKDLSMEALTRALDRIGYTIRFVPREPTKTKSA